MSYQFDEFENLKMVLVPIGLRTLKPMCIHGSAWQTRTPGYIRDGIRWCLGGLSIPCLPVTIV